MGGIAMRLLRSRARVQVDDDTQVEGQVERAVEIFSRVEDEIRDFVGRDLAASRRRLENCSDLTPANVASLLQRLPGTVVFDHLGRLAGGVSDPALTVIRRMLDRGRTWVKLSGAYMFGAAPAYAEALPIAQVDITAFVFPQRAIPGVNDYPSLAALMRHLLLHAAGNIRARALRQIQIHDIALLAQRMQAGDWNELLETSDRRGLWWALPGLALAARYYPNCIPVAALASTERGCPAWLRLATRHHELSDVSWSKIRIQAFPGIEWSKSVGEMLAFARTRLVPTRTELTAVKYLADTQSWARQVPWYGQAHVTRILRWIFSRPPRVQTMYSVQCALEQDAPPSVAVDHPSPMTA